MRNANDLLFVHVRACVVQGLMHDGIHPLATCLPRIDLDDLRPEYVLTCRPLPTQLAL